MYLKKIIKPIIPPIFLSILQWLNRRKSINFSGIYPNWEAAEKASTGYGSTSILQQVIANTRLVASSQAAFERDGMISTDIIYPYPLIACLLRAASEHSNQLTVLDFGGSLGSTYYQCRNFLEGVRKLQWCIVEQSHFVEAGDAFFSNDVLSFHNAIEDSIQHRIPQVIVFSGVLQYLPEPYVTLKHAVDCSVEYIIIDRTPFINEGGTILSLQNVPKEIVKSSYPAWLFNESELKQIFSDKYTEISIFDAVDGTIGHGRLKANFKGAIFKKMKIGQ